MEGLFKNELKKKNRIREARKGQAMTKKKTGMYVETSIWREFKIEAVKLGVTLGELFTIMWGRWKSANSKPTDKAGGTKDKHR